MARSPPFWVGRSVLEERGQTGFDFLVGMSVFLLTVGVVFTFVPTMFQPFDTSTAPNMAIADRSGALLAEDLLVEDSLQPGVLDASCTAEFFDPAGGSVPGCRFDEDASDLNAALRVDEFTSLNVTIESGGTIRSVDGQILSAGRAPPTTAAVVTAKRVVLLDGRRGTLFVRVW